MIARTAAAAAHEGVGPSGASRAAMTKLAAFFSVDTDDIALVRAQLAAFNRQVPLLYFVLCVNAVLGALAFRPWAPTWLWLYGPAVLVALSAVRTAVWIRDRHQPLSDEQARRRLRGLIHIGGSIGVVVLCWTLLIFSTTDDVTARAQAVISIAITALGSMTCLMHLRAAARVVATLITVPFAIFLVMTGEPHLTMIAVNLLLVIGAVGYVFGVASRDFDRMIRLSAENARLANVDSLTDLPNRRCFFDRLAVVLSDAGQDRRPFAVGVMDIDGFKAVNDLFGHVAGDRLLVEAGRRLAAVAGSRAMLARLGGDEFAFIVTDANDADRLIAFGEEVCTVMKQPFDLPNTQATVSASIGLARYPDAGNTAEELYERADYALYHAKANRRGHAVIFSDAHRSDIRWQSSIEHALRTADLETELSLCFQPLFDLDRGQPTAFEALARWNSPTLGSVPPGVFIPAAERSDLIFRITHALLRKALAVARSWPDEIRVSFNLSMRDIASAESIARIQSIVEESGLAANRIEFEITESALMADFGQALTSVAALRALGAGIALDDFGTGYSSLSHVHRLPLDKIKVDRSFVVDIESRESSRDILKAVIDLCHNLDIACVVEGTETAGQTEIVRRLGCYAMQGYFFARPMPAGEVATFLQMWAAARTAAAQSRTPTPAFTLPAVA